MSGNFGGLFIGNSGLLAQRKRLEVIGENIANVDSPGYHRRRAELGPVDAVAIGLHSGVTRAGQGVEVEEVTRIRNELLSTHAREQGGVASARARTHTILTEVESAYGALVDGGLQDQFTSFFNSFDDLASAPEDLAMRGVVLQRAETLAQSVNRTVTEIGSLFQRTELDLRDDVREINDLAERIAILDQQILASVGTNVDRNSLLDERDQAIDELAKLTDMLVVHTEDGQVTLQVDGHLLVTNGRSNAVEVGVTTDAVLTPLGYARVSVNAPDGRELNLTSGSAAANVTALQAVIPNARIDFDAVTAALVTGVNTLHQGGQGLDSSTGLDVFAFGAVPGEIEVSTDVLGQPERLAAAGGAAGLLDNSNARDIAALSESASGPISLYLDQAGVLAGRVLTAATARDAADAAEEQAAAMAQAESGVSLDEELTQLITAQRAYDAAARLMTTIDEMLQVLISIGRVGR
ncbi:MAG: flagellar hook-associated protein FlgK [Actinomycetota bacterium]